MKESQELKNIEKVFDDLFPINRSITGEGLRQTLKYIKEIFPRSRNQISKFRSKGF